MIFPGHEYCILKKYDRSMNSPKPYTSSEPEKDKNYLRKECLTEKRMLTGSSKNDSRNITKKG